MNSTKLFSLCIFAAFTLVFCPSILRADGFIVPIPDINISVKYHHVTVTIDDQIAKTEIDQVFINDSEIGDLEAIYVFPIPEGAAFSEFIMLVDDVRLSAEVLNADSAAAYYEYVVRNNADPALLEYLDQGLVRARIYPFQAHEEKRVKIAYTEILKYDAGVFAYLYPLNTEKFSADLLKSVSVDVTLKSISPIKSIYSPSHPITVQKTDDHNATVNYSEENVRPDIDFVLYYTVSSEDIGMHVLTHNPADEDGYFLLLAAPKVEIGESDVISKRMLFVMDRSGSMAGEKIVQAKEALQFCVNSLNQNDLFYIIDFHSEISSFTSEPIAVNGQNIADALAYIRDFSAGGGTNINDALLSAMAQTADDGLANMVIFLTDGQPTVGVTDIQQIRHNVLSANRHHTRLFAFGVGYGVNSTLLDHLSQENHGASTYVRPEEDVEIAVSSFFSKINTPVLSGLSLDYGDIDVHDRFPGELPDLFQGSQLIVMGRYRNGGQTTIRLSGFVKDSEQNFDLETEFPQENPENDFLPRLWATRKVGYLLDQIRLEGENQEVIDEIVALSKKHGIITPYTSFLITDETPAADNWAGLGEQVGALAFDNAVNNAKYREAGNMQQTKSEQVRYIGDKTFFLRDGFWVDSQLEKQGEIVDVEFASDAYFELLSDNRDLGRYIAVGKNVVLNFNDTNYRIHETGRNYTVLPENLTLFQNYPNPFNSSTSIAFELREPAATSISIYNLNGREVCTLLNRYLPEGFHRIQWSGTDDDGVRVASGIYFYKIKAGYLTGTKKMLFIQ